MNDNKEYPRIHRKLNILLAEDDDDDRLLFREVIDELPVSVQLDVVNNGELLLDWLKSHTKNLPDVLFLDLNMPLKNGFLSLAEIKTNSELLDLPVIIISTAKNPDFTRQVFNDAAHYYIHKPVHFNELKSIIYKALVLVAEGNLTLPKKDNFILTSE